MSLEKVTAYKCSDGKVFENKASADRHEASHMFRKWYPENLIYGNYEGSRADEDTVMQWLRDNKNRILDFLGERDPECEEVKEEPECNCGADEEAIRLSIAKPCHHHSCPRFGMY